MKKITTNGRSFGTAQSLTRQQLKNVMGGSATPTTIVQSCTVSTDCQNKALNLASATGSVSCTGKKCSRTVLSVTCDGTTTWC